MVTMQTKTNFDTRGWDMGGRAAFNDDITVLREANRTSGDILFLTIMSMASASQKMSPLTDVDPALVPASLACGAIGGTAAEFAALASASFKIGFDGEDVIEIVCDFSGLDSALDTPGYMTCGAIGATLPEMAAVADGQFGIGFDGQTVIQVGPLDFSGIDTIEDTPGQWLFGANGDVVGNWDALTDASFSYVVDGVAYDTGQMNFTAAVTFDGIVTIINYHLDGHATMHYDYTLDLFKLISNKTGETSTVAEPGAPAGGTDISTASWLNAPAGAATDGTGGENLGQTMTSIINAGLLGRGVCYFDGDAFVFISRRAGEISVVSDLTAGTAGTDISGAGFLNGLAGTNVQGTGGEDLFESIVDIINAELAGRGTISFDGDKFIFWSPTQGYGSAVSFLTAGTVGFDISQAIKLNGLDGTAVKTASSGDELTSIPIGIFGGPDILEADIIAADVEDQKVMTSGEPKFFNEDQIVLENSLDLDDIVTATGKTIRYMLYEIGLIIEPTSNTEQIAPVN
jgi:hypothetical protein